MTSMPANRLIEIAALAALTLLSFAAAAGWAAHGEAIFLSFAEAAWATCF